MKKGFTLIELLLAVSLMALLMTLTAGIFSNTRRAATASVSVTDRIRRGLILREIIQSELDLSVSSFSFERSRDIVRGFQFSTYGLFQARHLRLRIRYVFEPDENLPVYRLVRYSIPGGIGQKESRETILEGILEPVIQVYFEGGGEFVVPESLSENPNLLLVKFKLLRSMPKYSEQVEKTPVDDFRIILNNEYPS